VTHVSVRFRTKLKAAAGGVVALGLVVPATQAGAVPKVPPTKAPFTVVASGLANPRGLTFGDEEKLYVSEAGLGSGTPATGVQLGDGHTGLIQAIEDPGSSHPDLSTVVSGLWSSTSAAHGFETEGVAGISARGDSLYAVTDGLGTEDPVSGRLLKVGDEKVKTVANVAAASLAWEKTHPINPQFPDANPYGVLVSGHRIFVVDAAANTLDEVTRDGKVRVIAYFPDPAVSDAVPTCVAKGPDGALYVGTLAIAAGPGAATVFRVDPDTKENFIDAGKHVWASGLSAINGCAFSPDGKYFYASEYIAFELLTGPPAGGPPPGAVIKIPFSKPSMHTPLAFGSLFFPGGVAVSEDGSVYVSNFSNNPMPKPLMGQVVRLTDK
jgi:SMP-30/Gluconolactonase/LRE-like region